MSERVYLVGLRGSGKSTVGRLLAKRLALPFVDLDGEIVAAVGKSIAAIFADEGEPAFRRWESESLQRVSAQRGVIATGGGAVLSTANRALMKETGRVVWLTAPVATLWNRVSADATVRPALTALGGEAEMAAIATFREPLYREVADLVVDTLCKSPEDVTEAILSLTKRKTPEVASDLGSGLGSGVSRDY